MGMLQNLILSNWLKPDVLFGGRRPFPPWEAQPFNEERSLPTLLHRLLSLTTESRPSVKKDITNNPYSELALTLAP
ncbi:MAG: hypothetical protein ACOY16_06095 [Chloroflexota bacterium]